MSANLKCAWGLKGSDAWPPMPTGGPYGTYHAWRLMRMWLRDNWEIFQPEPGDQR